MLPHIPYKIFMGFRWSVNRCNISCARKTERGLSSPRGSGLENPISVIANNANTSATIAIIAAVAACVSPALEVAAQTSAARENWISAEFASIVWGRLNPGTSRGEWEPPELYIRQGEGAYERLQPQLSQVGPKASYRGPIQMPVYRRVTTEDGGERFEPVAKVDLPKSDSFLLFISEKRGGGWSMAAVDISEEAVPPGDIAFLNLTDKEVAADIRGSRQRVAPYRPALFSPDRSDEPDLPLRIAVFDQEWEETYSTVTRVMPDRSYLMVFFLAGGREDAYRLRVFRNLHQLRH